MTPALILTRPAAQAAVFAAQINAHWAGAVQVIVSPLMQIVHLPLTDDLAAVRGVVFTSAHGVAAGAAARLPAGLPAWCVGDKTAQVAADAGYDTITGPGDAVRLADKIIARRPPGPLVHLRGCHSQGGIAEKLIGAGIACIDLIAYDQVPQALSGPAMAALQGDSPVIMPLFSPRSAAIFMEQGPFSAPLHLVVISPAVQGAVTGLRVRTLSVAAAPDAASMLSATLKRLSGVAERHR